MVVEDDAAVRTVVTDHLRLAGCEVRPHRDGAAAWVLDTENLGFIAKEDLGGGYQPAGDLVESKTIREDANDRWRLRARVNFAAAVTDPLAGYKISGVA